MNLMRAHVYASLLLATPLLLGARGCVDELAVGVQAGPDAGSPVCCELPEPEPRTCLDGSTHAYSCWSDGDTCLWRTPLCWEDFDGGVLQKEPQCEPESCNFVISLQPATFAAVPTVPTCADGIAAECKADANGLCSYQCGEGSSCSGTDNACGSGSFCAFSLGTCGKLEQTGFCQAKPSACPEDVSPVCGCDGRTYNNACEALRAGVSISFEAACDTAPKLCATSCTEERADLSTAAREPCSDGVSMRGLQCVQRPEGGCTYQWLECPSEGRCVEFGSAPADTNGTSCWTDAHCSEGMRCEGALVCPCGSSCFSADQPGTCK